MVAPRKRNIFRIGVQSFRKVDELIAYTWHFLAVLYFPCSVHLIGSFLDKWVVRAVRRVIPSLKGDATERSLLLIVHRLVDPICT